MTDEIDRHLKNRALFRLGRSDMTARELYAYLLKGKRGEMPPDAEACRAVVKELMALGFVDDKRTLRLVLSSCDERLFGPRRIKEVLQKRMFSPTLIEKAMAREVDYTARAVRLLQKKSGADEWKKTPEGRKKLTDYLVRNGYSWGDAAGAISRIGGEE